ncbi:MAG: hypothetical protein KO463_08815 [Candidatus Methanofastidiosa archaeon]|nr:hypothetical protein [Candidatus Methanofastidiosa archaeon]
MGKVKGRRRLGLVMILLMLCLLVSPYVAWMLQDTKTLDVVILDNTVPDMKYREHKGLMWVLNYYKYEHSQHGSYHYDEDYYGFFPLPEYTYEIRLMPDIPDTADLVYIADSYGVYTEEFYGENLEGRRSELIYGGMYAYDLDKVENAVGRGIPLVAEFNTFGSPTTGGARERLYDLLKVEWTGWIGRYFFDLTEGVEVPVWVVWNYEQQYGELWEYHGPGFVFADENDRIVVLTVPDEATSDACRIHFTEEGQDFFSINPQTRYNYWFDIITLREPARMYAEFKLSLTEAGAEELAMFGIPSVFPAVVFQDSGTYWSFYFAGDFVDIDTVPGFYKLYGYDSFKRLFTSDRGIDENNGFYWHVYVPLVRRILDYTFDAT